MDPFFPLVFTFILLLVLIVGGLVILFPVTRRLGRYLEMQLEKRQEGVTDTARLEAIQHELGQLSEEIRLLSERQSFTDALLSQRAEANRLSQGSDADDPDSPA
ncbi:MAG: hypothetical protein GEU90_07040 [Gemmatimonas sp.]|nr:hypothetical protein [Gemmatimonas sp.]